MKFFKLFAVYLLLLLIVNPVLQNTMDWKFELIMKSNILIFVLMLAFIVSCGNNKRSVVSDSLARFTQIADTSPDLAAIYLDTLMVRNPGMEEEECMRLALLRVKLADKKDLLDPIGSIELIDSVVDFFHGIHDTQALGEAYYYKGRIHSELGNSLTAIDQMKLAKKYLENSDRFSLRSAISSQLVYLYGQNKMKEAQKEETKDSYVSALRSGDREEIIVPEITLAAQNIFTDSLSQAEYYIDNAMKRFEKGDTSVLRLRVLLQLANLRVKQGKNNEADSILSFLGSKPEKIVDLDAYNYISAHHYLKTGQKEKAFYFLTRMMNSGNIIDSRNAAARLMGFALEKEDIGAIRDLVKKDAVLDSVMMVNQEAFVSRHTSVVQRILERNGELHESLLDYEKEIRKLKVSLVLLLFFVCLCLLYILLSYMKRRRVAEVNNIEQKRSDAEIQFSYWKQPSSVPVDWLDKKLLDKDYRFIEEDWERLAGYFKTEQPEFYDKISGLGLSGNDLRVTMLIRVNVKPKYIAEIMNRTSSAITKTRKNLAIKYLDKIDPTASDWDNYIAEIA